jgi:RecA-family ATPase
LGAIETDFETYLNQSLEHTVSDTDTKILIIDNLSYLRSGTETAKDALPLMKHLKALKTKYNLSILVLAHTPKRDNKKCNYGIQIQSIEKRKGCLP